MSFLDQRLPLQVEIGAVRRDTEEVEIVRTDGGWEQRNSRTSQSLLEFDLAYPISLRDGAVYLAVRNLYKNVRGQLLGFRFRDKSDHTLDREVIGMGDGVKTQFQIVRNYTSGSSTFQRRITRPVNPIVVYRNNAIVGSGVSVDYSTGIVTFTSPPGNGLVIDVSGEFDVPVRFDTQLTMSQFSNELDKIEVATLLEIRQ